jgi:hypothetical protein
MNEHLAGGQEGVYIGLQMVAKIMRLYQRHLRRQEQMEINMTLVAGLAGAQRVEVYELTVMFL